MQYTVRSTLVVALLCFSPMPGVSAQNNTPYDSAHSRILCPPISAEEKSEYDRFGATVICRSLRETRGDRNDKDPFTFVPIAGKPIPPNPFTYRWSGSSLTFAIPEAAGFNDYVLCNVWRRINSEIPRPGAHQKHGLQGQITDRGFTYGWDWDGRSRSLTLGIYIAIVPKSQLKSATDAGVCKPLTEIAKNIAWRVSI